MTDREKLLAAVRYWWGSEMHGWTEIIIGPWPQSELGTPYALLAEQLGVKHD